MGNMEVATGEGSGTLGLGVGSRECRRPTGGEKGHKRMMPRGQSPVVEGTSVEVAAVAMVIGGEKGHKGMMPRGQSSAMVGTAGPVAMSTTVNVNGSAVVGTAGMKAVAEEAKEKGGVRGHKVIMMGVAGAVVMAVEANVNGGTKGHKRRMI